MGHAIVNQRLMMSADELELFTGVLPFVHTARERSFRKAAERLGVTSAAISKSVQKLEERIGVKLLARTSRSVALTPEGAAFLERCEDAVRSLQAARQHMSESRRAPRGELHFTLPFILSRLVVSRLPRLAARHPNLTFRISTTDRLVRLAEEQVDIAVRVGALSDSSLVARLLRRPRWVTVASPAYLARRGTPAAPEDLARHDGLQFLPTSGRPRAWSFVDPGSGDSISVEPRRRLLIDQGEHMLEAAVAGLGVCQILDFMIPERITSGQLVEVLAAASAAGPPIHAVATPERARSPNGKAGFEFLGEVLA